jgi:hypothetical protein
MLPFHFTAYIPSQKKTISLKELDFKSYKNLVKILTNNNNDLIEKAFNNLIEYTTGFNHNTYTF